MPINCDKEIIITAKSSEIRKAKSESTNGIKICLNNTFYSIFQNVDYKSKYGLE